MFAYGLDYYFVGVSFVLVSYQFTSVRYIVYFQTLIAVLRCMLDIDEVDKHRDSRTLPFALACKKGTKYRTLNIICQYLLKTAYFICRFCQPLV